MVDPVLGVVLELGELVNHVLGNSGSASKGAFILTAEHGALLPLLGALFLLLVVLFLGLLLHH